MVNGGAAVVVVSVGEGENGKKGKKVMMWCWGVNDKVRWCDTSSTISSLNERGLMTSSKMKCNFFSSSWLKKNEWYVEI